MPFKGKLIIGDLSLKTTAIFSFQSLIELRYNKNNLENGAKSLLLEISIDINYTKAL